MSAGFVGMDPAQAQALATKMNNAVSAINQQIQALTAAVNGVQWKGSDAERFKQNWSGTCVPSLKKVAETLRTASTNLKKEAAQQLATSK